MVRLPDSGRDGAQTMPNGSSGVDQKKVDAAIDDWRAHQLAVERETRRWRWTALAVALAALALGVWLLVEAQAVRELVDRVYRRGG